jgi:sialate O-acetylesterase
MHIKNKQEVGRRLALAALSGEYQEPVAGSSPLYDSMQVEGNKIRVFFRHAASGLATRNGQSLQGFAVAGADGKFTWAKARVDGDGVLVWSDAVPNPSAVRYAWADNPVCNLYNNDGLPCAPFRTDR